MSAISCPRGLNNLERSTVYLARGVHFLGCGLLKGSSCSRNGGRMLTGECCVLTSFPTTYLRKLAGRGASFLRIARFYDGL